MLSRNVTSPCSIAGKGRESRRNRDGVHCFVLRTIFQVFLIVAATAVWIPAGVVLGQEAVGAAPEPMLHNRAPEPGGAVYGHAPVPVQAGAGEQPARPDAYYQPHQPQPQHQPQQYHQQPPPQQYHQQPPPQQYHQQPPAQQYNPQQPPPQQFQQPQPQPQQYQPHPAQVQPVVANYQQAPVQMLHHQPAPGVQPQQIATQHYPPQQQPGADVQQQFAPQHHPAHQQPQVPQAPPSQQHVPQNPVVLQAGQPVAPQPGPAVPQIHPVPPNQLAADPALHMQPQQQAQQHHQPQVPPEALQQQQQPVAHNGVAEFHVVEQARQAAHREGRVPSANVGRSFDSNGSQPARPPSPGDAGHEAAASQDPGVRPLQLHELDSPEYEEFRKEHNGEDDRLFGQDDDTAASVDSGDEDEGFAEEWSQYMDGFIPDLLVTFAIPGRSEEYLFQDVGPAATLIRGAYFVGGQNSTARTQLKILDPNSDLIFDHQRGSGIFHFSTKHEGVYSFVLFNHNWSGKSYVTFVMSAGNETALKPQHITPVNEHVATVARMVQDVHGESQFFWMRQKAQMEAVQQSNRKVFGLAFVELFVVISVACVQVVFLKNLLSNKRMF